MEKGALDLMLPQSGRQDGVDDNVDDRVAPAFPGQQVRSEGMWERENRLLVVNSLVLFVRTGHDDRSLCEWVEARDGALGLGRVRSECGVLEAREGGCSSLSV